MDLTRRSLLVGLGAGALSVACGSSRLDAPAGVAPPATDTTSTTGATPTSDPISVAGQKVIFSLNVHDWVNPAESATTIQRVLDIHDEAGVPVDIYLTDPTFRVYLDVAPELVERLAVTAAGLGYHHRPPYPWYAGFDTVGLDAVSDPELDEMLRRYATEAIDLSTGETTGEPGGYAYITDVLGRAPTVVGSSTTGRVAVALHGIYREMGATAAVARPVGSYGDQVDGLWQRPEDAEIKLYEEVRSPGGADAALATATEAAGSDGWIGIKYHENNFYLTGTPFWPVYWTDSSKSTPRSSPWDTSRSDPALRMRTAAQQDKHWALYASAVEEVASSRDLTALGIDDVVVALS